MNMKVDQIVKGFNESKTVLKTILSQRNGKVYTVGDDENTYILRLNLEFDKDYNIVTIVSKLSVIELSKDAFDRLNSIILSDGVHESSEESKQSISKLVNSNTTVSDENILPEYVTQFIFNKLQPLYRKYEDDIKYDEVLLDFVGKFDILTGKVKEV